MTTDSASHLAWIALGSNIDPAKHLPLAVHRLSRLGQVTKVSSVWESAPVGFVEQPRFCNAALCLRTSLSPQTLREELRKIELNLGRQRDPSNKNAPRTIDLDIAMFDDLQLCTDKLRLPDPEISERPFLAHPLAELQPDYIPPGLHRSLEEISKSLNSLSQLTLRTDIALMRG